jgi:hypothetical protein
MAATLDLLERPVSQKVAATVEQTVIGPVRSVQAMMARDTIVLQQAPWLIMAVGGLLGYASARKARLLQRPSARAIATPPFTFPSAALWTSSSALTAIIDSLNRAYDVEEGRPFWKVRLTAIGLTVGLSAFIVVALVLLTFGPQLGGWVADLVGLGRVFELTWNILRWPAIVCLLVVATALVYYFAPDVEQEWKWITPGSACAVLGWLLASLGFAFYVNHFGSYNATYGSIGAVIVLLTWMYVSGLLLLVGGEINAEIEHAAPSGKDPGEKQLSTP